MTKYTPKNKSKKASIERKALVAISIIFLGVMATSWIYAMHIKQTIAAGKTTGDVDVRAPIEVEKLRNSVESQFANSRAFFLLGSSNLFDAQKKDKQTISESLVKFEKQFSLPQIPEIVKRIDLLQQQHQEIFDQGMDFRAKQTESKIVGQFYQSKATPIRQNINKALDEIGVLHNAELERHRAEAKAAVAGADVQIPQGMAWLTATLAVLFFALVYLVVRMLSARFYQVAERDRLFAEAQKAVQSRDEIIVAVSQDLKEPLSAITQTADGMINSTNPIPLGDGLEYIKSSVFVIDSILNDILDQTKTEMGVMTLRLDQLSVDSVLDEARLMLQPTAKKRDIRLQIDTVNPPVLAFMDHERVMRVLLNLVGNAIKFSPKHSKVVVKTRSDQQFVHISVADSGPGIPEGKVSEIFTQFWQARKTADQGAGIGLSLVKTIIEAHGGTVHVTSQSGHGSTFTFSLPRRRPVGVNLKRPAMPTVKQTASNLPPHSDYRDSNL